MSKYKVGDVAALFSKPKEPSTETGKKLQSLFKEYNSKKAKVESYQNIGENESSKEIPRESKKNRKRKFSAVSSPESNFENTNKKLLKKTNGHIGSDTSEHNEKDKRSVPEVPFPRTQKSQKNKGKKINNTMLNEYHVNATGISDTNQESDAIFESKKNSKSKNEFSGFIKKSKQLKETSANAFIKKFDGENLSNANALSYTKQESSDNILFKKKMKNKTDFTKEAKKQNVNSETKPVDRESSKKSKVAAFSNDETLKGEIEEFVKKSAKKMKKKHGDNCFEHSLSNLTDSNSENEDNEKSEEKSSNESFLSKKSFKDDAKDFIRSAKKSIKRNDNTSFIQNTHLKKSNELDFIKLPKTKSEDSEEKLQRTLFVGNLPVNITKMDLNKLFSPFGEVEDIRYHGIETDKAKIFGEDGSKILTANNYAADSVPGFIVFTDRYSAIHALSLSGSLFKGRHITVDFALASGSKKLYEEKRSIFIGNLPFSCSDESVWDAFSECGRIENVRVVRDKKNGIGKGFGYVQFSTVQAKENALALEDVTIQGRLLRIKAVESNKTAQKTLSSSSHANRDSFKSRAIRLKKKTQKSGSRKSVKKIMKKQKNLHNKKKIANILQKSMK